MFTAEAVVIGAGQAGLAASRCLSDRHIEHVVIESGRIGERWLSQRWDSLHLLTPNWMNRLPGWSYTGGNAEGFMSASEFAGFLTRYAQAFDAPVLENTRVLAVRAVEDGFSVSTTRGSWSFRNVIIATGANDLPRVPALARELSGQVMQVASSDYRNPDTLPEGGVLIVGASASGVQIADELVRANRRVVLAVGRHTRLPRRYRGLDVMWWLEQLGVLDRRTADLTRTSTARSEPSLQIVGHAANAPAREVNLTSLRDRGVWLAGRLVDMDGTRATFADNLSEMTAAADDRLTGLLQRIDTYISDSGLEPEVETAGPLRRFLPDSPPITSIDLASLGISTVVWATGYRRSYDWLKMPVVDSAGELVHTGGVTPIPGLYGVGLPWQSRRKSSFIDGVRHDARAVVSHLAARTGRPCLAA